MPRLWEPFCPDPGVERKFAGKCIASHRGKYLESAGVRRYALSSGSCRGEMGDRIESVSCFCRHIRYLEILSAISGKELYKKNIKKKPTFQHGKTGCKSRFLRLSETLERAPNAFCKMCVIVCGKFVPNSVAVAHYGAPQQDKISCKL